MESQQAKKAVVSTERDPRIVMARLACSCLGAAMVIWGITPAVLDRILTGKFPSLQSFGAGVFAVTIGLGLLTLQAQFGKTKWALSVVNVLALVMMFVSTTATIMFDSYRVALFPMVLASFATFSTWLAMTGPANDAGKVPPLTDAASLSQTNNDDQVSVSEDDSSSSSSEA